MLDDITKDDHPLCLVAYAAALTIIHIISHTLCHPSNPNGNLSTGIIAVNRHRYANKIVGIIHAIVLATTAVRCYFTKGFDIHAERLLELPSLEHLTVGFMMVYLVYDTIFMLWRCFILQPSNEVKEKWSFAEHTLAMAHHILGFTSWWLIYSGNGGVYWAQWIHIAEISTPILNIRWIMMKEGIRSGTSYLVVGGVFLITFFASRIPTTAMLLYYMYQNIDKWPSKSIAWFQFFVTFSFWCINLMWFRGGIKAATNALKGA